MGTLECGDDALELTELLERGQCLLVIDCPVGGSPTLLEMRVLGTHARIVQSRRHRVRGSLMDISDRKRIERELAAHRDRLEELVDARTQELREAERDLVRSEHLATIGQLVGTVSHELRNPLATLRTSHEILKVKLADTEPALERVLARIERALERCELTITELLDYSRVRELELKPTAIDDWLKRWLARLGRESERTPAHADAMDRVNPVYIPRNHKVQEALDAAVDSNLEPFRRLLSVLERPFDPREGLEEFAVRAPDSFGRYTTYCGT